MTSNVYLLDENKSKFMSMHNWNYVEITLDVPPETHDNVRKLMNNGETFEKIWKNISIIIKKDYTRRITLRINVSRNNYKNIESLLKRIKNEFGTKKFIFL